MKRYVSVITGIITVIVIVFFACEESPVESTKEPQTSVISGYVRDSINQPIFGAIVVDNGQAGLTDTTDQTGAYKFEYKLQNEYKTKITVYAAGYHRDTAEVTLPVGGTVTKNFQLRRDWSQVVPLGSPKPPANIKLLSVSDRNIAIRGTGMKDYSTLQFQITDSSGIPLTGTNKAVVRFSLLSGPKGGEYISPDSVETDINGIVTTTVWSGTKAGLVQVNATTRNGLVKAMPVTITITGGYPDAQRFSMTASQYNVAGQLWDNLTIPITVIVGDRYLSLIHI
ncbi:MAG: carboxypeptidase regulatory-like domain-containing protein, partial [Bacteroidetes bacterium]|nr:carboxypeptidase regulatory-like domain-containing protein [Bacteroidota bacterium]